MADVTEITTTPTGAATYPQYQLNVKDSESGTLTPVNAKTCTRAVVCDEGINMQEHLQRLYEHVDDQNRHITDEEREKWNSASEAVIGGNYADKDHTHAASDITGGTFAGEVAANADGQTPGNYAVRNSKLSAEEETPTVNGQICWQYE